MRDISTMIHRSVAHAAGNAPLILTYEASLRPLRNSLKISDSQRCSVLCFSVPRFLCSILCQSSSTCKTQLSARSPPPSWSSWRSTALIWASHSSSSVSVATHADEPSLCLCLANTRYHIKKITQKVFDRGLGLFIHRIVREAASPSRLSRRGS
jgi:hypothetical protein